MAQSTTNIKMLYYIFIKRVSENLIFEKFRGKNEDWCFIKEEFHDLSVHQKLIEKLDQSILEKIIRHKTFKLNLMDEDIDYLNEMVEEKEKIDDDAEGDIPETDQSSQNIQNLNNDNSSINSTVLERIMSAHESSMKKMFEAVTKLIDKSHNSKNKVKVNKFDGKSEDAKIWLTAYEKACEANGWSTCSNKVINLRENLDGIALKWYNSKISETDDYNWDDFKSSFTRAFGQNKVQLSQRAWSYKYLYGDLLDFYFEKQRLIDIAFPRLSDENFITMMICGLLDQHQTTLLTLNIDSRDELRDAISKLKPIKDFKKFDWQQEKTDNHQPSTSKHYEKYEKRKPFVKKDSNNVKEDVDNSKNEQ